MSIRQGLIIRNVNKFLAEQNFPIEMNKGGICRGLSLLHAQYVLAGKEDEFRGILAILSGRKKIKETEKDEKNALICRFVTKIMAMHNPKADHRYDVSYAEAYKKLHVGGGSNPPAIQSLYKLGLVTTVEKWASIIQKLDLQPDEVMLIGSGNHAVSLVKRGETYHLYDPNNDELSVEFTDETKLMSYLHEKAFSYTGANLGLSISIVSHIKKTPEERPFPDKKRLYNDYYKAEEDLATYYHRGKDKRTIEKNIDSLILAATAADAEGVKWLLSKNEYSPDKIKLAATTAIQYADAETMKSFLDHITQREDIKDEDKQTLLLLSLSIGNIDIVNTIKESKDFNKIYNDLLEDLNAPSIMLAHCLKGGNPEVIGTFISDLKNLSLQQENQQDPLIRILNRSKQEDFLLLAINSNNPKALEVFLDTITESQAGSGWLAQREQNLAYLETAIINNNPEMVTMLLNKFEYSKEAIASLKLSLSLIKTTDPLLLRNLEERGLVFSPAAEALIRIKEKECGIDKDAESVKYSEYFGILFTRFSEFIRRQEKISLMNENFFTRDEKPKKHPTILLDSDEEEESDENERSSPQMG